jgi:hypothetical protein
VHRSRSSSGTVQVQSGSSSAVTPEMLSDLYGLLRSHFDPSSASSPSIAASQLLAQQTSPKASRLRSVSVSAACTSAHNISNTLLLYVTIQICTVMSISRNINQVTKSLTSTNCFYNRQTSCFRIGHRQQERHPAADLHADPVPRRLLFLHLLSRPTHHLLILVLTLLLVATRQPVVRHPLATQHGDGDSSRLAHRRPGGAVRVRAESRRSH